MPVHLYIDHMFGYTYVRNIHLRILKCNNHTSIDRFSCQKIFIKPRLEDALLCTGISSHILLLLQFSLLQFAILYQIFFISIFIQLSVNRKDIHINKRRCITLAQRMKKVVDAPINTIPIILITKFSIHAMSTDSGTCSIVKSADTFYQFKQCQEHNYNNNENLNI